jgi:hypothetical protein
LVCNLPSRFESGNDAGDLDIITQIDKGTPGNGSEILASGLWVLAGSRLLVGRNVDKKAVLTGILVGAAPRTFVEQGGIASLEACFLTKLAQSGFGRRFTRLDPATGQRPVFVLTVIEVDHEDSIVADHSRAGPLISRHGTPPVQ